MIKAIFFDMDDTLIVNNTIYEYAEAMLYGYLGHFGITPEEAQAAFLAKDKELFPVYGYSQKRMPASFEAVLKAFIPDADDEMVATVRGYAERIFVTEAKMKPGTPEAIAMLAQHYDLYIVTAGDRDVQERRVDLLPFKDAFAGVTITDKKTEKTFTDLLAMLNLKPDEVVMIGDSLKSDIVPSAAAGLHAVWIEALNAVHETVQEGLPAGAYKYSSLLEAARHIIQNGAPGQLPQAPHPKNNPPPAPTPPDR